MRIELNKYETIFVLEAIETFLQTVKNVDIVKRVSIRILLSKYEAYILPHSTKEAKTEINIKIQHIKRLLNDK